jgi:hypothetical protein
MSSIKEKSAKMLETNLAGKTTKKRQNSDTYDPLASTELPHVTLYRQTKRAPTLPEAGS